MCCVMEITSAALDGRLCSLAALSGLVMSCVNGPALGAKASRNAIECVDAVPCDGVARNSVRAVMTGREGVLPVQSCTASVLASSQPRISNTIPLGAVL
jgi:hypothetical protein